MLLGNLPRDGLLEREIFRMARFTTSTAYAALAGICDIEGYWLTIFYGRVGISISRVAAAQLV